MRGYDRGYDYGLRGWPQARPRREPVRTRYVGGGPRGAYDRDFGEPRYGRDFGRMPDHRYEGRTTPFPNRVTRAYNLDYVREQHPGDRPVNYAPYGGDVPGRVIEAREYRAPYQTIAGTRTWRGEWPMGWERGRPRYGDDYPIYREPYGHRF